MRDVSIGPPPLSCQQAQSARGVVVVVVAMMVQYVPWHLCVCLLAIFFAASSRRRARWNITRLPLLPIVASFSNSKVRVRASANDRKATRQDTDMSIDNEERREGCVCVCACVCCSSDKLLIDLHVERSLVEDRQRHWATAFDWSENSFADAQKKVSGKRKDEGGREGKKLLEGNYHLILEKNFH